MKDLASRLSNKKKVLIVNDNYQEIEVISRELKRNNFYVFSAMSASDCYDKIEKNKDLKIVFLNDEMESTSAVELLSKIDTKKVKVIVMLNPDKEFIKKNYLNDYPFYDYMLKRIYKEEIQRIKEKI